MTACSDCPRHDLSSSRTRCCCDYSPDDSIRDAVIVAADPGRAAGDLSTAIIRGAKGKIDFMYFDEFAEIERRQWESMRIKNIQALPDIEFKKPRNRHERRRLAKGILP